MLELESDPYPMFIFAMNAAQTREKYTTRLKRFFDFIALPGITMQERRNNFVEKDKGEYKWLLNSILNFCMYIKKG